MRTEILSKPLECQYRSQPKLPKFIVWQNLEILGKYFLLNRNKQFSTLHRGKATSSSIYTCANTYQTK